MTQHQNVVKNEFDAAKAIVETLTGLDRQQQERAIRFATEALGLKAVDAVAKHSDHVVNASGGRAPTGATDIKKFTETKSPSSDQQFAAVVAYFYQFEAQPSDRRETIDGKLLGEAARLANRRRPSRYALNNAKNAGYLDSAGHGEFKLNTVGENLVAMALPSSSGKGGTKRRAKKKGTARKSTVKKRKAKK